MLSISQCKDLENFKSTRLSTDPYPENDRPRGKDDLTSLTHHRRNIRKQGQVEPIWVAYKNGKYTLLDGAHRIIATYLENKRSIPTYIIHISKE